MQTVESAAMSYLVLARKYRPRNFSEMVGQEHVVQALTNALTQQRLHHAYMFTGTRGVGKTTVSRILAKSLNCTGADGQGTITATPCGVCPACTEIDSGRFPDYIELDAASNRGVDEVQSLLEQAVYKPVQGRFKVFMIDEVHMLTNTAFNAMLKTLEEPPEYLKFVLATTDPQKVPVTVLSRCLQFNLRPMAAQTVLEHLQTVLAQEGVAFEQQALRLLAQGARGSMRDALSLTDQAIAFGSGQLQEATVRQMLGAVDRSHVFALLHALAAGNGRQLVETVDVLRIHGISAAGTLQELAALLQRMAVLQAVPGMELDPSDPDAPALQALATAMPADEIQLCYSIALHGQQELGLAPDEYAGLTMVLLRPLAFKAPQTDTATAALSVAATALAEKKTAVEPVAAQSAPAALPAPAPAEEPVEVVTLGTCSPARRRHAQEGTNQSPDKACTPIRHLRHANRFLLPSNCFKAESSTRHSFRARHALAADSRGHPSRAGRACARCSAGRRRAIPCARHPSRRSSRKSPHDSGACASRLRCNGRLSCPRCRLQPIGAPAAAATAASSRRPPMPPVDCHPPCPRSPPPGSSRSASSRRRSPRSC